jgi:hypothetical protein
MTQKIKTYKKLPLPKNSAWGRKTWRRYVHWKIRYFLDGVCNILRWAPTLYKDRDWDDYYITKLLQKKIEHQRKYLVKSNRHTRVDYDNYWMTVLLNLIEREHESYYELEYQEYVKEEMVFNRDRSLDFNLIEDNSDIYLTKYKGALRRMIKENYRGIQDKMRNGKTTAFLLASYNQQRNRKLIFKILERYSAVWWD